MRKTFLSILALSLLVSALSLAPSASSAPVATGYTASEYRDLTGAANYLNVTPEYLQRFGVRTIHFILGISGKLGTKGDVYYNVIDANGPYKFTSDYVGEDLESILVVMDYHTVTPQQAQKIGAAFMTFISGLDAAQKGVDIEKFKQNPPTTTKPTTTTKPKPTTTTSTTSTTAPGPLCAGMGEQACYDVWAPVHKAELDALQHEVDNMACLHADSAALRAKIVDALADLVDGDPKHEWLESALEALDEYDANCAGKTGWLAENWGFDAAARVRRATDANPGIRQEAVSQFTDPYWRWDLSFASLIATFPAEWQALDCDSDTANALQAIQEMVWTAENYFTAWPIPQAIYDDPGVHPAEAAMEAIKDWAADRDAELTGNTACTGKGDGYNPGLKALLDAANAETGPLAPAGPTDGGGNDAQRWRDEYHLPSEKSPAELPS